MERIRAEIAEYKYRMREIDRRRDKWVGTFDPTQRKDHVPFSKGIANEFATMIGRLLGRVLFVLLLFWIVYSLGFFR
jgi:hypothetical protein